MTPPVEPVHVSRADNDDIRLIVVIPWRAPGSWDVWKKRLEGRKTSSRSRLPAADPAVAAGDPDVASQDVTVEFGLGPVPVTGDTHVGIKEYVAGGSRYLIDAVATRLLAPDNRRHALFPEPLMVYQTARARRSSGSTPYRLIAADILFVEDTCGLAAACSGPDGASPYDKADNGSTFLVALHLTTTASRQRTDPVSFRQVHRLVRGVDGRSELSRMVSLMLEAAVGSVLSGSEAEVPVGRAVAEPFHIVYVPYGVVAAQDATGLAVPSGSLLAAHLDASREDRPHHDQQVVAAWLWATLPRRGDETLEGEAFARYEAQFHHLSQSWSAYASHNGCAFVRTQEDHFYPLVHVEGFFVEAVLLVLLQRYRAVSLANRLAKQASRPAPVNLDAAIALDSEAVGFVVTEQWRSASTHRQFDFFYSYLADVMQVSGLVDEAREQAHLLRENTQIRIGRLEEQAEAHRAESNRVMEQALAILTFVGLPLTVLLEIWVNWDSVHGVGGRTWRSWVWLAALIIVSVVLGWAVAKVGLGIRLNRPRRRTTTPGGGSDMDGAGRR